MKNLYFLSLFILCGCTVWNASTKTTMQSWINHHKSELIRSWGPPSWTSSDGMGGEILVYDLSRAGGQIPGTVSRTSPGNYEWTTPERINVSEVYMFYINEGGYIYYWRAQSNLDALRTVFVILLIMLGIVLAMGPSSF